MGNTALTRAFFKRLSLLTKDEEITSKCSKLDYRREGRKKKAKKKAAIFIRCQEEKNSIELYYVQNCLYVESDPVSSLCPTVGIPSAKELQGLFCKEHRSLRTPCLSQELLLLRLLFLAVKSEKSSQRSNRIRLPLSPFVAEKERGLI